MPDDEVLLVVRVLLAGGAVHAFAERRGDRARTLLRALEPERLFERDALMVVGERGATTFRTRAIRRIELHGVDLPGWAHGPGVERLAAIDARAFEVGRRQLEDGPADGKLAYARLEDSNGEVLYLESVTSDGVPAGRVESLLDRAVLYVRRGDDSALLLNTEHVESITVHPAPASCPSDALPLEITP